MNTQKLLDLLDRASSYIASSEVVRPTVSQASVGWHLEHIALVINKVTETMEMSHDKTYDSKFNLRRCWILLTGNLPRGKSKSPQSVRPDLLVKVERIELALAKAKKNVEKLKTLDKKLFFKHHLLGDMRPNEVVRFFVVHTTHHLSIIGDIVS